MIIPLLAESPAALAALSRATTLYTDLDGTLLGLGGSFLVDGSGVASSATAEAVASVNTVGFTVVITTGRNRIQTGEIARLMGWRGYIAELGCIIVPDRGAEPIYLTGDWPAYALGASETPHDAIARVGAVERLMTAFPGQLEPHAPYHHNREATHLLRGSIDVEAAAKMLGSLELPVAIIDNGIIHPISTGLSPDITEIHAYHLMPPGVTKRGAVASDMVRRGLAREQTIAVGDSVADVEMAGAVGTLVLVGNALRDSRVLEAAAGYDNIVATTAERGSGWAEFASSWRRAHA
ncbi:MAG: HAD hydrolase family protein [Coriobacteriia bacterium]|nr:HAD hydrolase family protein [Coriobacteriia bacterium]